MLHVERCPYVIAIGQARAVATTHHLHGPTAPGLRIRIESLRVP
jgi:hypothetical protein